MRYKEKIKDYQLIVRAKTSFGESIDEKALSSFLRVNLRGFMKATLIRTNVIEYTGPIGVSLAARMQKLVTKREFLFILEHCLVAFQRIEAKRLSMNNVVLDLHNVYINENTKEVQFLYVPSSKPKLSNDPLSFLEAIIYSAKPAPEKDMEYISRAIYFLRSMKGFDPAHLEKFIAREDRSVVTTIRKQNVGDSDFITSKQRDYLEHVENRQKALDADDTALLEDDDRTGLLVEEEENTGLLDDYDDRTGLLTEENDNTGLLDDAEYSGPLDDYDDRTGLLAEEDNNTGLLDDYNDNTGLLTEDDDGFGDTGLLTGFPPDDENGTALLNETPVQNLYSVHYPTLYRVLTGETISINKPVFRLGKERSYVDYFVANNVAVSRSHADIISRGGRYYVLDLNSKNRTYINDQPLPVQYETEIQDGDHLRLGNEDFIFRK